MSPGRILETAAALAFAAWQLAAGARPLWLEWTLPAAAFWIFCVWSPPESRKRTPVLIGVMSVLLCQYLAAQLPLLLDLARR